MIEAISGIFRSSYWPAIGTVLILWGIFSLFALIFGAPPTRRGQFIVWTGIVLMVASTALSMAFENYLPNWHLMDPLTRATRGFGLSGMFLGFVLFVAGGVALSRAMLGRILLAPPKGRGRSAKALPPMPAGLRPRLWPGGALMLAGSVVFVLGSSLHLDTRFPIPGFWALFGL